MTDHVQITRHDRVLVVALDRVDKKNAVTQAMYAAMAEALEQVNDDREVRAVLFRAEGESFCAGNDIGDFIAQGSQSAKPEEMPVFRFLKAMAHLEKPAVAAVRGRAVGIGLTLLLHCDLVVVAEDALLSVPFVNLGLTPEAASSLLLPLAVGHRRAFEMFALGQAVDGRTAEAWGLANRAVPSAQVDEVAAGLADALAARAPAAVTATKRLMRDREAIWSLMIKEGEVFAAQMRGPEAMEAFMAFTQKRAPDFSSAG